MAKRKKKAKSDRAAGASKRKVKTKPSHAVGRRKKADTKPNLAEQLLYGDDSATGFRQVNPKTHTLERVATREEVVAEIDQRREELNRQYHAATRAIPKVRKWIKSGWFGADAGCTIGLRQKFGQVVSPLRYVIEVHVPFKIDAHGLDELPTKGAPKGDRYRVPPTIDDVLIKVIESKPYWTGGLLQTSCAAPKSGVVRLKSDGSLADMSTNPAIKLSKTEFIGGIPVVEANKDGWGTLGIAFSDTSGRTFGLVNAHFADGSMVQPPSKPADLSDIPLWDMGTIPPGKKVETNIPGTIGNEKFYVDAALIALNHKRPAIENLVHDFGGEPFLFARTPLRHFHPGSPRTDLFAKVFKFGARTLERLEGFVENPEDDSVRSGGRSIGKVIRAKRQSTGTFTVCGDSGSALISPIYDLKTGAYRFLVVGLCFGGIEGDATRLYASHFSHVIQALDLRIPASQLRDDWAYNKPT
jgi:hypothetical protein